MNDSTLEATAHVVTRRPDNSDRYARYAVCTCGWGSKARRKPELLAREIVTHLAQANGREICVCSIGARITADNGMNRSLTTRMLNMDAGVCNACGGQRP